MTIEQRLQILESHNGRMKAILCRRSWMSVLFLLNGFALGAILSCTRNTSANTIEAQRIVLKDPSGHTLAVLGVDNKWNEIESKEYYPGIEFRDEKGKKTMSLFGTGLSVWYGDSHANLNFTGLEIGSKESQILLNEKLFSFSSKESQATLLPHSTGMNFTVQNGTGNEFGVVADSDSASMYAASRKWEVDIVADKTGTHIVRGQKPNPD